MGARRPPHALRVPGRCTHTAARPRRPSTTPQSKKRGLSLEEKRDKVLEVFLESADVFLLKVRL